MDANYYQSPIHHISKVSDQHNLNYNYNQFLHQTNITHSSSVKLPSILKYDSQKSDIRIDFDE